MKNLLKEKMLNGEQTLGTFHKMGSEIAIELLAYCGMDYVLIDTEHGPFDVESTARFIRAADLAGTTPLVRIKDGERNSILKILDVGAMGLIIPNIETVEEVKSVVSNGKYQPIGNRGIAPAMIFSPSKHKYHSWIGSSFNAASMLSRYASSGTPHFSWNHFAAFSFISGFSVNFTILYSFMIDLLIEIPYFFFELYFLLLRRVPSSSVTILLLFSFLPEQPYTHSPL